MKCKSCGAEVSDQALFCTNCGAKIDEPAVSTLAEDEAKDVPVGLEEIHEPLLPADEAGKAEVPVVPFTAPAVPAEPSGKEDKPVSAALFFWLLFFGSLPVIGLFVNIIIVSRAERVNLKNFCVAMLVWHCIFLFLILVGLVLGIIYLDYVNDFLSRYFNIMILPKF